MVTEPVGESGYTEYEHIATYGEGFYPIDDAVVAHTDQLKEAAVKAGSETLSFTYIDPESGISQVLPLDQLKDIERAEKSGHFLVKLGKGAAVTTVTAATLFGIWKTIRHFQNKK